MEQNSIIPKPPQDQEHNIMLSGITPRPELVGNIIDSFSLNKVPGPDDIQPEHLLAQLFNALAACKAAIDPLNIRPEEFNYLSQPGIVQAL